MTPAIEIPWSFIMICAGLIATIVAVERAGR